MCMDTSIRTSQIHTYAHVQVKKDMADVKTSANPAVAVSVSWEALLVLLGNSQVVQCVAVRCSVLQCVAVSVSWEALLVLFGIS